MEESIMLTERDKFIQKHLAYIEQGQKMDNLTAAPEWEFFSGWLQATKDRLQRQVNSTAFVNDHNGYLDARAGIATIDMIFDGIEKFKKNAETSAEALRGLDSNG